MDITWKEVGATVAKAAPILGAVLGGPVGAGVAGIGSLVAATLGVESTPQAVNDVLKADPAAMVKVIELQESSKVRLQGILLQDAQSRMEHEQRMAAIAANDRDSARNAMKSQPEDKTRQHITYMMICGGRNRGLHLLWHSRGPSQKRHQLINHRDRHRVLVQRAEANHGILVRYREREYRNGIQVAAT